MATTTTTEKQYVKDAYDATLSFIFKATKGKRPLSNEEAVNAAYLLQQTIAHYEGDVKPDELTAINKEDTSNLTPVNLKHICRALNDRSAHETNSLITVACGFVVGAADTFFKNAYGLFDDKDIMDLIVKLIKH